VLDGFIDHVPSDYFMQIYDHGYYFMCNRNKLFRIVDIMVIQWTYFLL